jgi:2-beta-glucuronyltransferase
MSRAVLVSGHYIGSKRRAGFHWIADAFRNAGWDVTFVTVGFSQLSRLKSDHRFDYGFPAGANHMQKFEPGLDSYVWFTPYHPLNRLPTIGILLLAPLFRGYGRLQMPRLESSVADADLIVFESTSGLMLVDRFRAWAPRARLVYRVSDDLRLLRAHPVVLEAEARALSTFDLVSVPAEVMRGLFPAHPNVRLQPHGIDAAAFDARMASPYTGAAEVRAVFVGAAYVDRAFVESAAREFPRWEFHVIGPVGDMPALQNVIAHGELPFSETVRYIVHADVGLACLRGLRGGESFSDSLKVIQYTYARLPIVAPEFMRSDRSNVFTYRPGDAASIKASLLAARAMDRSTVDRSGIWSWTDLATALAGPVLWP